MIQVQGGAMIQILMDQITQVVGPYIPRVAAALGILVVGWLIALIVAAIVRGLLRRTTIDNRLAGWFAGDELAKEGWKGHLLSRHALCSGCCLPNHGANCSDATPQWFTDGDL